MAKSFPQVASAGRINRRQISRRQISRRRMLWQGALGLLGMGASGSFLPALADQLGNHPARRRHCILLWMPGGPSQLDTFDMKPGHANGGLFSETATRVPGMRFSEHLPKLAKWGEHLAIIRSLQTREGDHERGTYLVRTGQTPGGPVRYPTIGASLAKQMGGLHAELPSYVQIGDHPFQTPGPLNAGFLGPQFAPAMVRAEPPGPGEPAESSSVDEERLVGDRGDEDENENRIGIESDSSPPLARLGLEFLRPSTSLSAARLQARTELWRDLQTDFRATRATSTAQAQDSVHRQAIQLMHSETASAFELDDEPESLRRRYGPGIFGQGCLLARRLVERGVPFVEVSLGGNQGVAWDTHVDNFPAVRSLSEELDAGWSTLLEDLQDRGLLDSTTILWMGEFGRTPTINTEAGRDHYPQAWSCVFSGGGIQGGAIHGATSADGREVIADPVSIGDVLTTLCTALGVDPASENYTELGRPIRIAEGAPIRNILTS